MTTEIHNPDNLLPHRHQGNDLPVCRLCGIKPIRLIDGTVKHDEYSSQCNLRLSVLTEPQWNALMAVPGGEAAAVVKEWNSGGSGHCFTVEWIAEPRDGMQLYTPPAPAIWNSPDIIPNVKRGGSGFFVVAVRRANGKIYTFPAAYLNKMELSFEDCSVPESGYGCVFEETEDGAICSGWFDWKTHADYDDFYQVLLEDGEELVAWACLPVFGGQVAQQSPAPAVDDAALYQSIAEALGEAMDCSRPWSAWDYDTLCRDDFHLLVEDSDRVNDIVDAVKAAMKGD